jgi:hypothetical protein
MLSRLPSSKIIKLQFKIYSKINNYIVDFKIQYAFQNYLQDCAAASDQRNKKNCGKATRLTSNTTKLSDALTGPPSRCLRFYSATRFAHEFIKKITHIPSASFSPVGAPGPGCERALPSLLLRTPSANAHSRPVAHASRPLTSCVPPAPSSRARWCWWCSLRPSRVPPTRSTQAQCWWHWCSCAPLVLVASGARAPPLVVGSHPDSQN